MKNSGWIKTELKTGKPRWHFILDDGTANRQQSLCGHVRTYTTYDTETRHITDAANCQTCVRLLKKLEKEVYESFLEEKTI